MVRERLNKAQRRMAVVQQSQSYDLTPIVHRWLRDLKLTLGEGTLPSPLSPVLDLFGLLRGVHSIPFKGMKQQASDMQFSQVRGFQEMRSRVLHLPSRNTTSLSSTEAHDQVDELRLVFLVNLVLLMDPTIGTLRRAITSLLIATEHTLASFGSAVDDLVLKVCSALLDQAEAQCSARAGISHDLLRTPRGHPKVSAVPSSLEKLGTGVCPTQTIATTKTAISLQGLIDVPAVQRVFVHGSEDLCSRSMAVLADLLEGQAPQIGQWRRDTEVKNVSGEPELGTNQRDGERYVSHPRDITGEANVSATSMDCCREILKTAWCLMSSRK